jgi:hypothetical protein
VADAACRGDVTGPVGLPLKVAELGPLSCAPPLACGLAAVSKLPLMSPE